MPNILIIISSLCLLISCTEDKDNSKNPNNNIDDSPVLTTPATQEISSTSPLRETVGESSNEHTTNISADSVAAGTPLESEEANPILNSKEAGALLPPPDSNNSVTSQNNIDTSDEPAPSDTPPPLLQKEEDNAPANNNRENNETFEAPTFKVNKNDIVLGNANSEVVLIEYYSPTCPHCAYYNKAILPALKKKYTETNKIAYVIREFIGNKEDLDAAILQRCANNLDSFLKFQAVILEQQDKWAGNNRYRELLINIGKSGGISAEDYETCRKDDKIVKILIANTNLANNAPHFIGTPTFFINGQQISGGYSLENLSNQLDKALQQTK
ncbi:DsbA family protein [Candidatus Tisiphia endosymbiont of Nemotelus uliginosus]|uniref:DsbA family protein n=1 Tax=Candidatus Tisiphia endosymbiont of Nemotelus uliginosus TaxID=3077926 RepID=UPI0035C899F0